MIKITSAAEAISRIKEGSTIMLGGFMCVGTPQNLVDELVSQGKGGFTIICNDAGTPGNGAGKLLRSGQISGYITSHIGLNPEMGAAMNDGTVAVELVPQGTLAERIRSAGAGLGGFYTPTGVGTLVEEGKERKNISGTDYILETALGADAALIKAQTADTSGNLVFSKSARNFNPVMATAADYVVAEVEEIVETGHIDPDSVMLPGIFIDALVLAPREELTPSKGGPR